MNLSLLQTLTWGTVIGAIVSALALAAAESALPKPGRTIAAGVNGTPPLPTEPTAAGPVAQPAPSSAGERVAQRPPPARR